MLREGKEDKWGRLTRRHARRTAYAFGADFDDLRQTAALTAEVAARDWREDGGMSLVSYVWRAVAKTLPKEALRQTSPVSASRTCARNLFGLVGDSAAVDSDMLAAKTPQADALLDEYAMIARVRDVVMEAGGELAYRALLCDVAPQDLVCDAEERRRVYAATRKARDAVRNDRVLRQYAKDIGLGQRSETKKRREQAS